MDFDLKNFRTQRGYVRLTPFAKKIDYSQSALSRMENGTKPLSDNVLLKIEDAFEVNLDEYKKKSRNKLGKYLPIENAMPETRQLGEVVHKTNRIEDLLRSIHPKGSVELKKKYTGLIAKRHEADSRFWEGEEEQQITEEELALENNLLLKELVIGMRELISLVKNQPIA